MTLLRRCRAQVTPVGPQQIGGLLDLCAQEPVASACLAHQIQRWSRWGRGDAVVIGRPARPRAAAWTAGAVMPFGLAARPQLGLEGLKRGEARALAEHARPRLAPYGSIMGPRQDVEILWRSLRDLGTTAREERWSQPLLGAPHVGEGLIAAQVRRRPSLAWVGRDLAMATSAVGDMVLDASVDMFTGELGYDPTDLGSSYARHVGWLVDAGRSYIVLDDGQGGPVGPGSPRSVAFKADVGSMWHAPSGGVAMITGVWTRPDLRGRGLGAVAMAGVVDAVRRDHVGRRGEVSLYVNDFNTAALGLYSTVGFTRTGTFSTVLL